MLKQRKCLLSDLVEIIGDASDITVAEAQNASLNPWTLLKSLWEAKKLGEAQTICAGEEVLFCIGHYPCPLRPKRRVLWMIARQSWFDKGAAGVMFGRRFMKALCARHPGVTFESSSWSRHPELIRWFTLQGFTHTGYGHGSTVFEISRKG